MAHESLAERAREITLRLAEEPRAAGSEVERRARDYCADYLARHGFTVAEEEFTYSAFPGKWGVPVFGLLLLSWFVVLATALDRLMPERTIREGAPFVLLLPLLYVYFRRAVARSGALLRTGVNLVAVRGDGDPRMWLMAHLDSKSQPLPMLVRIAGIVSALAALVLTLLMGLFPRLLAAPPSVWVAIDAVGILGSLTMLLSTVGNRSPGAVDNASGVAAALLTASLPHAGTPLGVVLTSAEELGLAGAGAWAERQAARYVPGFTCRAVNFDSLDDVGKLTCMADRWSPLSDRVRKVASDAGRPVVLRRVLPGIMVDATALDSPDWSAVTLSKGSFSTLSRIHSSRDTADRLSGTGIAEAVELATEVIRQEC